MKRKASRTYAVTVGNIGTVYCGSNFAEAHQTFVLYVNSSKDGIGRASGESVVFWIDGEPVNERRGAGEGE